MQDANSGTLTPQISDTHEAAFQINYLAPFLLVLLLLQSMHPTGRIVLVSSYMHNALDPRPQQMGVYDLTKKSGRDYTVMFESVEAWRKGVVYEDDGYKAGMRRYGASKLGGVMFMYVFFLVIPNILLTRRKGTNSNAVS
jgi:NAD(P)-dependent dehydrogenase (short-subunit alcohol dehydrogenase family)